MDLKATFEKSTEEVKQLTTRPSTEDLLQLYALFKQSTEGDVQGKRPGMLDIKARAKFDAWSSKQNLPREEAMKQYVQLVKRLQGK